MERKRREGTDEAKQWRWRKNDDAEDEHTLDSFFSGSIGLFNRVSLITCEH